MPELPEVETTRNGIAPYLLHKTVWQLDIHNGQLRWPVLEELPVKLQGRRVNKLLRRGKYIIAEFDVGSLLIHLGMSGSLRIVKRQEALRKHDHVVLHVGDASHNTEIRYHDPRRFGAWVWTSDNWREHKLISHLGPEPLSKAFNARYLFQKLRKRKTPIKTFIMDSRHVVGVGNIYANEALFIAGIRPTVRASKVSKAKVDALVDAIKQVLSCAIEMGGTTLQDFVNADNNPGYFQQTLKVYGREGENCIMCSSALKSLRMSNRATVYCAVCQK